MPARRIFVAIDIDEDVRSRVAAYASQLRARFPDVPAKWEKPEKLHVTLKFVGNIHEAGLTDLTRLVGTAADSVRSFNIRIARTGAFEKRESAVLWVDVAVVDGSKNGDPIQSMANLLDPDRQPKRAFKPHLTVARIKNKKAAAELINAHRRGSFDGGELEVRSLTIYESCLLPTGSVYSVVSKHPLATD